MPLLGGIRPPIALLCVLLLALAGLTAKVLGPDTEPVASKAVLSSQEYFAQDGAIALRASIDERVTDLERTATALTAGGPADPERVLSDLSKAYQKWTGTTVLDLGSGKVLAARGERIPLAWLDEDVLTGDKALTPRMVRLETGDVRLMTMAVLDGKEGAQQLLIASNSLSVPSINLGPFRSMAVVAQGGEILATAGFEQSEALNSDAERKELTFLQKQMTRLSDRAAKETEQNPISAREPGSRGYPGVSGTLLGEDYNGRVATAGYASLAASDPEDGESVAAGLGLTVVAMLPVVQQQTVTEDGRQLFGLLAAGALVLLGLLAVAVLWMTVQRPLLGLFLESRRLARGDLIRPVTVPRWGEAARIGAALERTRCQLGVSAPDGGAHARPARKFRGGARGPLVLTAVLLLLWCIPVGFLLNRTDGTVSIPAVMVNDQRDRTDLVADRARRALNEAQADLVSISRLIDIEDPAATEAVLKDALREHTRYQALYVVGEGGGVIARAGDDPHDWSAEKDLSLVRVSGRGEKKPVVQAGAPVPEHKGMVLVGEVRVEFLNSLLKRPGLGEVRIVNADARTLAASDGFLAFEGLPNDTLPDLVRAANVQVGAGPVENGLLIRDGGAVTVAAAAPFTGGGVASDLGWTIVSWQDAGHFEITAYEREDRSVLASLLGIALIVVCLGWIHLVVVRPLRALAAGAEKLAAGDLKTVHYPRYQDEVGAVVRSLELIRQQLQARRQDQVRRPAESRPGAGGR